jgi:hypothetical protein
LSPQHGASSGCRLRDSLQLSRVASNILNKQPRPNDKGWSSSLDLGVGLTIPHRKSKLVTKSQKGPRTWTDSLDKRPKRPRRIWVENNKMHLIEAGWGDVDWIGLAQDRYRWRAHANELMNLRLPYNFGKLLSGCTAGGLSSSGQLHRVS